MDKADMAIGVLVVLIVAGIGSYTIYRRSVQPKSPISVDRINVVDTEEVGWEQAEDGGWIRANVQGKWIISLTINEPEKFTLLSTEIKNQDAQEAGITNAPEDAEIRLQKSVSVEFKKNGQPYFVSPLAEGAFKYPDWDSYLAGKRYFPYLKTTDWEYFVAPYDVTYEEDGSVVEEKDVAFGPEELGWTTGSTYRINDIIFTNIGYMTGYDLPPGDLDLAAVRDVDGSGSYVFRLSDLRNRLKDYDPPSQFYPDKTYEQFWNNIDLGTLDEAPEADKDFEVGLYEEGKNFADEVGTLYYNYLPRANEYEDKHPSAVDTEAYFPGQDISKSLTSFERGDEYWLMEAGSYGFPTVTVEAPADKFNTVLWYPPSGDVEILEVSDIEINEESYGEILVKFKNVGETPASFSISVDTCKDTYIHDIPGPTTLDPEEVATKTVTLGGKTITSDSSGTGTVAVNASRTNNSDSMNFYCEVNNIEDGDGGDGGADEIGDVKGLVLSKETQEPIPGATVYTNTGQTTVVKSDGTFNIEDVPSGEIKVSATASDYKKETVSVDVVAGETVSTGAIALESTGEGPDVTLYLTILIVALIISAGAVGSYYVYKKEREV